MPTCTPQLCFGDTAPSYAPKPDYASCTLFPPGLDMGEITVEKGLVIWGENKPLYPGTNNAGGKYNENAMKETFMNVVWIVGSFNGVTPKVSFQPYSDVELLVQLEEKIACEDVQQDIKSEIISRAKKFVNSPEALEELRKQANPAKAIFNITKNNSVLDPGPNSCAIQVYKAIQGGQVNFPYLASSRIYRTQHFFFNVHFKVTLIPTSLDFCKKVDDQFALDLTTVTLDPKWQKILISDDPKATYCDCLQMTVNTNNLYLTEIDDGYFLTPESAAQYAHDTVRDNSASNLVGSGFGPLVNSSSAAALFQAMADQGNQNQLMYGFLGNVLGFATKHLTLDGPLLECGWVIPLTADTDARVVLAALSRPTFKIGLNEARQLATNPNDYFQQIKNSLIAAGFGPRIPHYDAIDDDIRNKGVPSTDQTQTNIDLNGTTTSNEKTRESGSGTVNNTVGQGGAKFDIVDGQKTIDQIRGRGRQVR